MLADQRGDPVVHLFPQLVRCDGANLARRDLDGQIERAPRRDLHDDRRRPPTAAQKLRDHLDWFLRGRQADADDRLIGQRLETLQRERQMRSALVVGHRVDFVDNHRAHVTKNGAAALGRWQQIKRLGRRHQNVWRLAQHRAPLRHQRVARANRRADVRDVVTGFAGQLHDFREWSLEVLLDVVAERFERRHVHDLGPVRERAVDRLPYESVDAGQKRRERLARPGGRRDQRASSGRDVRPAGFLRLGGRPEAAAEPRRDERTRPGKVVVHPLIIPTQTASARVHMRAPGVMLGWRPRDPRGRCADRRRRARGPVGGAATRPIAEGAGWRAVTIAVLDKAREPGGHELSGAY